MTEEEQYSVLNFIANCNEFISGRFLFTSVKISQIADAIEQSPPLLELYNQCLDGFNKSLENTKAFIKTPTKPGYFVMPEELDKFIALAFGVILDVKAKQLDFNLFLKKYFSGDEKLTEIQKFSNEFLIPLRNTIAKYFELSQDNTTKYQIDFSKLVNEEPVEQTEPEVEEEVEQEEFEEEDLINYDLAKEIALELLNIVKNTRKVHPEIKSDAIFVLSEIISACEEKDIHSLYALILGLKYIQPKFKNTNALMKELLLLFDNLEFETEV